jgi:acyl-coenzyme A thioesterase PaaI-like protein
MSDPPPFDPATDGWSPLPDRGFVQMVGPIWTKVADGRRRFGFVAEPRHGNLVGVVQGGMMMTFADRALGMLAWEAAGAPLVTVSYEHQFVGPGRIGSFIQLEGEVVRATSGLIFMRGIVSSPSGTCASCQGTWKVLSKTRRIDGPVFPD